MQVWMPATLPPRSSIPPQDGTGTDRGRSIGRPGGREARPPSSIDDSAVPNLRQHVSGHGRLHALTRLLEDLVPLRALGLGLLMDRHLLLQPIVGGIILAAD